MHRSPSCWTAPLLYAMSLRPFPVNKRWLAIVDGLRVCPDLLPREDSNLQPFG